MPAVAGHVVAAVGALDRDQALLALFPASSRRRLLQRGIAVPFIQALLLKLAASLPRMGLVAAMETEVLKAARARDRRAIGRKHCRVICVVPLVSLGPRHPIELADPIESFAPDREFRTAFAGSRLELWTARCRSTRGNCRSCPRRGSVSPEFQQVPLAICHMDYPYSLGVVHGENVLALQLDDWVLFARTGTAGKLRKGRARLHARQLAHQHTLRVIHAGLCERCLAGAGQIDRGAEQAGRRAELEPNARDLSGRIPTGGVVNVGGFAPLCGRSIIFETSIDPLSGCILRFVANAFRGWVQIQETRAAWAEHFVPRRFLLGAIEQHQVLAAVEDLLREFHGERLAALGR
mmetsp:Transcript_56365/g.150738  ORF Transcript_56365/g.150738 Transcript_56365/m.150738 type:complete len:350 (+) Transcript_56365:445-1494(+)